MCRKIREKIAERARGFFLKGNEPWPMEMEIIVAPCECGEVWYAKVDNGVIWVEAEKFENRDVLKESEEKFRKEVSQIKTEGEMVG